MSTASLISESKNAYQQSLSLYQSSEYVGAREQAMASADFAHAAEELAMSSNAGAADTGIPRPPTPTTGDARWRASRDIQSLGYRISAINSSMSKAAGMPGSTVAEAKSLMASSLRLQQQAQSLAQNQPELARHLVHAADALTHVAEHLENRYLIAAGIMPTPPPPPPGPDGTIPPLPAEGAPPPPPQP